MATEERNIENIDLAEENKEINGTGEVNQISEERKEEIVVEITKVSIFQVILLMKRENHKSLLFCAAVV